MSIRTNWITVIVAGPIVAIRSGSALADRTWAGSAAVEWGFPITFVLGAFLVAALVWPAPQLINLTSPVAAAA